jgi:hypothetical protein
MCAPLEPICPKCNNALNTATHFYLCHSPINIHTEGKEIPTHIIIQIRDLVHEYGNAWDHTIEEENDLLERLCKFYKALPSQSKAINRHRK